jgi:LysR family nitrogen assimilation transcriptional regulator
MLELHRLRYFLEVVDRGSFSAAAIYLGVAQSALSRQVKELEEQVGVRLLDRTGRGVTLTDFGKRFLPSIRAVVYQSQQLLDDIRAAKGEVTGRVGLGMLQSLSGVILTPLLLKVSHELPEIEMHVREGLADHVEEWLDSGHADIGVLYARAGSKYAKSEFLMSAELFLIGAAGDPKLQSATCPLREVSRLPLILPALPNRWRQTVEKACTDRGLRIQVEHEFDSPQTVKDFVRTPGHYTLLPLHAVRHEVDTGLLAAARIVNPGIVRDVLLSFSKRRPTSRASLAVANLLRAQIDAQIASGVISCRPPKR